MVNPAGGDGQGPSRAWAGRGAVWRWFLLGGFALVAVVPWMPPMGRQATFAVAAVVAVAAMVCGLRWHRPAYRTPWLLMTTGVGASLGGVMWWTGELALTAALHFPSVGDLLYVCAYPLFIATLLTWARRDRARFAYEAVVDAAVAACGLSGLAWAFIISPIMSGPDLSHRSPGYLIYTLLDLLIIALALRLLFSAGVRTPSYVIFVAGLSLDMTGDMLYYVGLAWNVPALTGATSASLWVLAYVFFAAATLHPSMSESTGSAERVQRIATPARLSLYALLALVGPAVAVGTVVLRGRGAPAVDLIVPMVVAAATAVLLVARLGLLAHFAHRRAIQLDNQAVALNAALHEQQELRAALTAWSLRDDLTGLGNRVLLRDHLDAVTGPHALLLLDLDGFQDVNDLYGHAVGDTLLTAVADRLREAAGDGLLVRLGGDEFAVLLVQERAAAATDVARALVEAVREPFQLGERETMVTASVGVLSAAAPVGTVEALRRADMALYAAKGAGKNRVEVYADALAETRDRRMRLIADLRRALADEALAVHYQPVVDLDTGRVTAVEALVRWRDGTRWIPPGEFIPIAEESGLVVPLGAWVLRRALADVKPWFEQYGIAVTVNVSGRQLREPDIADVVLDALEARAMPGAALVVEITETVLVADVGPEAAAAHGVLDRLRGEGIRVAVDDFGTGYSSLAYLRTLPVDVLKIDRAFVQDEDARGDSTAFLQAIVQMARSLRLRTVAEAVETEAQAERLRQLDCPLAQGYYFARPMPASELTALLARTGGRLEGEAQPTRAA
ncbi:putative bifunctional diguanylate cyclase/phosphodiesterase [Krasilnikovia sp. MM14-A1004]|uniref:putative bifunctional diguanylate cyclase/phosphodiesterase n=1 Tax=Krasilnikovia sp. MM14-A1004 TaxID=3373541 RepID=UPI00399CE30B